MKIFSDDDIIRSVIEGRTQNYEIIINRYKKKIINFINKMIHDYDEAQNISQDVFLKVYTSLKKYDMQDNFSAFIFTIARNLTLNYIKKDKRTVWFSNFLSQSTVEKHFSCDAPQEEKLREKEKDQLLMNALQELNENQRLALILKIYLDFSYKKIADITGWSIPKIETLISRAKSNLKSKIILQEKGITNV